MSSYELPSELISLIIDHLHDDKPTLKTCALVGREWVAPSRFHLLRSIHLYQDGVDEFLSLCDSPVSTIQRANIYSFRISTNRCVDGTPEDQRLWHSPALDELLTWRSSDEQRTLATVLSQLRILTLDWIGWWTLSRSAKENFAKFEFLRELKTWNVEFESLVQFSALLGSFPKLEVLTINGGGFWRQEGISDFEGPSVAIALPPRLHTISLESLNDHSVAVIEALLPCPSLRIFHFRVINFSDFGVACGAAIGKLLASTGTSLEVFSAQVQAAGPLNDGIDMDARFQLIDFTKNTRLQRIRLDIEEDEHVLPFLQRLTNTTIHFKPFTPALQSLEIKYLARLSIDWETLDVLLQHPYFSALSEIKYTVVASFGKTDVVGQPGDWFEKANEGSDAHRTMLKNIEEFGARLPLCRARGILRPEECYYWWDRFPRGDVSSEGRPKWKKLGASIIMRGRTLLLDGLKRVCTAANAHSPPF
ncbi:hypothetical protein BOTBODRAFT_192907 [Botryobasidium botryosum FD-172 SS1]|uniref:F-box domain-containing protein n=1 Tax=Botryobasidium botryosum (strain FD-172 SS1) TaxID=930990 RepID=A0A067LTS1_BOTB1|nr:hypothetical protein BOTBODRAFT_192907 [Botryobasidium botryosum FD-172 SS1]